MDEETLYEGGPAWPAALRGYAGGTVLILGGLLLAWKADPWALLLSASGLVWMAASELHRRSVRYKLTTHRLLIERGVLGRSVNNLDMFRVEDVRFDQAAWQRLFGVGDIVFLSTEPTVPRVAMQDIHGARELFEKAVVATKDERARQKTMVVEGAPGA